MINGFFDHISTNFSQALVIAITSSLISGLFIIGIVYILLKYIDDDRSSMRYWILYISLSTLMVITLISFINSFGGNGELSAKLQNGHFVVNLGSTNSHESDIINYLSSKIDLLLINLLSYHKYVTLFWCLGFLVSIARFSISSSSVKSIRRKCTKLNNTNLNALTKTVSNKIGLKKHIAIFESSSISSPLLLGIIKPAILFPIGLISNLSNEQIELIILHEMAHLKRFDPFFKSLQSIIETLLFFNPAVWVLSKEIDKERENCCDDIVVSLNRNEKLYAKTLSELADYSISIGKNALALFGRKNHLLDRIKRIVLNQEFNKGDKRGITSNIFVSALFSFIFLLSLFSTAKLSDGFSNNVMQNKQSTVVGSITSIEDALKLLENKSKIFRRNVDFQKAEINSNNKIKELEKSLKSLEETEFSFDNPYNPETGFTIDFSNLFEDEIQKIKTNEIDTDLLSKQIK